MIDQEYVGSIEQTKKALEAVERELADRLHLDVRNVRAELIALDLAGTLVEDAVVRKWHQLYCGYLDWLEHRESL